jgi:GH15 family glucan-1,4-alpha-glucosidase
MCWAACDRLARIANHLGCNGRVSLWQARAAEIREAIEKRAWNEKLKSFTGSFEGTEMDAGVLLMGEVGFLCADDPRFASTVDLIGRHLRRGDHLLRYDSADDFGEPSTAFNICIFWYIDALVRLRREDEARALFETVLKNRNSLGLLSEDIDSSSGELWGNYPQTYSLVGIINAAVRLSKPWERMI